MEDRLLLATLCRVNSVGDNPTQDVDDGQLTLREAIRIINGTYTNFGGGTGHDGLQVATIPGNVNQIVFLNGNGQFSIAPRAELDPLLKATFVQGQSASSTPSVTLVGTTASISAPAGQTATGLTIAASNCQIEGLAFTQWSGAGIRVNAGTNAKIDRNFLGVTVAAAAGPNGFGIVLAGGSSATVGGSIGAGNVISGNINAGILIDGTSSHLIAGNTIGLDIGGSQPLPNQGSGILIRGNATGNTIGGTAASARNLIAGNGETGVTILGPGATRNVVLGNYIGVNQTGSGAAGNGQSPGNSGADLPGILINNAPLNTIGGSQAGNVIAANLGDGITITGASATGNLVRENLIGVAADGSTPLGNAGSGVTLLDASANVVGPGNVLSGNANGLQIRAQALGAFNNVARGNLIGTDRSGTVPIGNGNAGVLLSGAVTNTVGGALAGDGNVISGNGNDGLVLLAGSDANVVQGNSIGVDGAGNPLPNRRHGIRINGSNGNTIGRGYTGSTYSGGLPGAANILAYNAFPSGVADGAGVAVESGSGNAILSNAIYSNQGLGIDLRANGQGGGPGVGANDGQVAPVLTAVQSAGGVTLVRGTLTSTPNTTFLVEFYANAATDANAESSGKVFLDSRVVATDANGVARFADGPTFGYLTLGVSVADGNLVNATATALVPEQGSFPQTYAAGSTSEFSGSASVNAAADVGVTLTVSPGAEVGLNSPLTYTALVTNTGPNPATGVVLTDALPAGVRLVSVSSPGLPTILDASLATISYPIPTIASGVTIAVTIVVTPTAVTSGGQGIVNSVSVSVNELDPNASNNTAAAPGDANGVAVKIIPGTLALAQSSFLVQEPAAGDAAKSATIVVNRTGGSNGVVTVDYAVAFLTPADGANAPSQPLPSGTLTFADGEISKTIAVPLVHNDGFVDVQLGVTLANPGGGAGLGTAATGQLTIANIDTPPKPVGNVEFSVGTTSTAENGGPVTVLVTRTGGSAGVVTATVTTRGGSAVAGRDYTAVSRTVTFADGDISPKAVSIPILRNGLFLGTQTIGLALGGPTGGAGLGDQSTAQVVILEGDAAPPPTPATLQFDSTVASAAESAATVALTVLRSGDSTTAATVSYTTADGTAIGGRDYVTTSGTLSFAPGQVAQTILVPLLDNGIATPTLGFRVLLSNPGGGATVGTVNAISVSLTNVDVDRTGATITDLRALPGGRGVAGFAMTFDQPLDRASAADLANYEVIVLGPNGTAARGGARVALQSARLDASGTVLTLTPRQGLAANRFYQIRILAGAGGGLVGSNGNVIDGDASGTSGGDFRASIGWGTALTYVDGSSNLVSLGLARGGVMELTRSATGQGQRLTLSGIRRQRTVLTVNVRRQGIAGTGRTTFNAIDGAGRFGDVDIRATSPPVIVGSLTPAGVRSKFRA